VQVYNTFAGCKQAFEPREPGKVRMYVCGPTTYNYIHLGNARALVVFDTIRRYLIYKGYDVLFVQNFTDVDDKIINRAREEGVDALELSKKYIQEYFRDADALNIMRADVHPKVSEHMPDIIDMVEKLLEKGAAYEVDGDVYFDVQKFAGYGKLSKRSLDEMIAGARVEVDERKRHPMDFALWKKAKPGEPSWESPWGPGRPGWHIECSAMSLKYLGTNFDIHGGGYDLIFPHHENEIAQSEAATGKPFVRYWLHNGFITVNQEKMSKSLGNFFLVREILDKFAPEVVRFYLISTHYRSPLDFDDGKLREAGRGLKRIRNSIELIYEVQERPVKEGFLTDRDREFLNKIGDLRASFESAMDDDFNTALATGTMFNLARQTNTYVQNLKDSITEDEALVLNEALRLFKDINMVLGIFKTGEKSGKMLVSEDKAKKGLEEELIDLIVAVRQEARERKDWATADRIRDGLKELGIILEDTPRGTRWKKRG